MLGGGSAERVAAGYRSAGVPRLGEAGAFSAAISA
jgi:hypothetical protein